MNKPYDTEKALEILNQSIGFGHPDKALDCLKKEVVNIINESRIVKEKYTDNITIQLVALDKNATKTKLNIKFNNGVFGELESLDDLPIEYYHGLDKFVAKELDDNNQPLSALEVIAKLVGDKIKTMIQKYETDHYWSRNGEKRVVVIPQSINNI
jgi:hypothetical protein